MANLLRQNLSRQLKTSLNGEDRIAILAIGSSLRGEDAVGLLVGERLKTLSWPAKPVVKVFIGETAPENLTGEIRTFQPSCLLVIDAVDADAGKNVLLLDLAEAHQQIRSATFSTHNLPLTVMLGYMAKSLQCRVLILGIPIKSVNFGEAPSASIRGKARRVADSIHEALGS